MKIQSYLCEKCGVESHVYYEEGEDVISVVHKIEDDHAKWSPLCKVPVTHLKAVND